MWRHTSHNAERPIDPAAIMSGRPRPFLPRSFPKRTASPLLCAYLLHEVVGLRLASSLYLPVHRIILTASSSGRALSRIARQLHQPGWVPARAAIAVSIRLTSSAMLRPFSSRRAAPTTAHLLYPLRHGVVQPPGVEVRGPQAPPVHDEVRRF